jgi:hypothetical protein
MGLDRQCHTRAEGAGQLPILSGAGLLHCLRTRFRLNSSLIRVPFRSPARGCEARESSRLYDKTAGAPATGLAAEMSATWIVLAGKGRLDNPAIPRWLPYTTGQRATIILNRVPVP